MPVVLKTFFEYLFGLYLFEILRNKNKVIVFLYLLFLCLIFSICWIIPLATLAVNTVNEITYYYDERFPEIHISTGKVMYIGTEMPILIEMPNGGTAIFDTSGIYTSIEDFSDRSILFTKRAISWSEDGSVERIDLSEMRTFQKIEITPQNIKSIKNALFVYGILIGTAIVFFVFSCVIFFIVTLGSGVCILFDTFRSGTLKPGETFTIAAFAATPFLLFFSAGFLFNLSIQGLLGMIYTRSMKIEQERFGLLVNLQLLLILLMSVIPGRALMLIVI